MKTQITSLLIFFGFHFAFTQTVVSTRISPCDKNSNPAFMHVNRLISKEMMNDTLVLKMSLVRNCEFSPVAQLRRNYDSMIVILEDTSSLFMACECCFELEIKATGIMDTDFQLYESHVTFTSHHHGYKQQAEMRPVCAYKNKYVLPTLEDIELWTNISPPHTDSSSGGMKITYYEDGSTIQSKTFYSLECTSGKRLGEEANYKANAAWYVTYAETGEIVTVCGVKEFHDGKRLLTCLDREEYIELIYGE